MNANKSSHVRSKKKYGIRNREGGNMDDLDVWKHDKYEELMKFEDESGQEKAYNSSKALESDSSLRERYRKAKAVNNEERVAEISCSTKVETKQIEVRNEKSVNRDIVKSVDSEGSPANANVLPETVFTPPKNAHFLGGEGKIFVKSTNKPNISRNICSDVRKTDREVSKEPATIKPALKSSTPLKASAPEFIPSSYCIVDTNQH